VKISEAFPSNYLKATDLAGRTVQVAIDRVEIRDVGDSEHKPVIFFRDKQKGLVLNRINAGVIAGVYGEETDGWCGQSVELYPSTTEFHGRMVDCLRVRITEAMRSEWERSRSTPESAAEADIPF